MGIQQGIVSGRPVVSRGLGINTMRGGGDVSTIRQVATDSRTMDANSPATTQGFFRTHHRARDDISVLQFEFPNWFATSIEENPGSDATIHAAIEYPIGAAPTRILFSGVAAGTIPDGGVLLSDALNITIPNGAEFAVKTFFESASGIIYTVLKGNSAKEKWQGGTGALTDQTMTSNQPTTFSTLTYGPSAIIARSTRPAFFLLGDSKVAGSGELSDTEYKGEFERDIGPSYAFVNAARSAGALKIGIDDGFSKRVDAAKYCTHILSNYGINDIASGVNPTQFIAALESLAALFSQPVYQATIAPQNASTDGWVTTENQTVGAKEAERISVNNTIRAGVSGVTGVLEIADVVETSRNSGIWKAGYTADGTHETPTGYAEVASSGVVDPLT